MPDRSEAPGAVAIEGPYRSRGTSPVVRVLRGAREVVFGLANATRISSVISRTTWRRNRLLILCYHGVSIEDEHKWADLHISQSLFDRRLAWLKANRFAILPLSEALEGLKAGQLPPRSVALTFDDGLADFALRAMPVLGAHDAPATVYLTTYYHTRSLPVYDVALSYLMWKGAGRRFHFPIDGREYEAPARDDDPTRVELQYRFMGLATQANLSSTEKHDVLASLAESLGVDFSAFVSKRILQIMSQSDIAGLDARLIRLELHTHRHRTPHDRSLFRRELDDNRAVIESIQRGGSPRHFCYPSGQYTAEQVRWLAEYGISSATTCNPGIATRESNPLLLPRFIDAEGVSDTRFSAWAHGTGALLAV